MSILRYLTDDELPEIPKRLIRPAFSSIRWLYGSAYLKSHIISYYIVMTKGLKSEISIGEYGKFAYICLYQLLLSNLEKIKLDKDNFVSRLGIINRQTRQPRF